MSYRSGHQSEFRQSQDPARQAAARQRGQSTPAKREENGYTLVHAGKQVRFGPVAFWIVVGTVTTLGMWSAATATYFAFRDDVLTRLIARQAEMQYAYEDRIAELRAKVDRATSRQLLDQEQFDQKLDQIMRRQTALELRASAIGGMSESRDRSGRRRAARLRPSLRPPVRPNLRRSVTPPCSSRRPIARRGWNRAPQSSPMPATKTAKIQGVDNVIVRLQTSLDQVERRQLASLTSLEDGLESRARRMRGVFSDLGLDIGQLEAATPRAAMGGPLCARETDGRRRCI